MSRREPWPLLILASAPLLGLACSASNASPGGISDTPTSSEARHQSVVVDAQRVTGTLRSLQGAHWDPGPPGAALSLSVSELGIDWIRTHDAGGIDGSGSGDIDGVGKDRLFPDLAADPTDPASYNFGPTDALIQNIRAAHAEVFFRVGRSNIGGLAGNVVPADFDKYAQIVRQVVMHYNHGWSQGFRYGIRYFEIWNEPDFLPF
ncbi:MAG TPA: hypothetical protein VMG12_42325, partial [Polyangiaceae bacterium]|nr:hypothetical protein [Polyangiaceae bacterium]